MNSYLDLLNKLYSSKKPVKTIKPDDLTASLCKSLNDSKKLYIKSFLNLITTNTLAIKDDFELEIDLSDISFETYNITSFLTAIKDVNIGENTKNSLESFSSIFPCANKSVLSVIWGNVINDSINQKRENINELIQLFLAVSDCDKQSNEMPIADIQKEILSIFSNNEIYAKVKNYFSLVFNKHIKDDEWYNFDTHSITPEKYDFEFADIEINNDKELLDAVCKIENLGSVLEYLKGKHLKKEKNEYIKEYKAFYLVLKIVSDSEFQKLYPNFNIGNTYGYNIDKMLEVLEKEIRTADSDIKASTVVGFQNEAKKIANTILGKNKVNEFAVWNNVFKKVSERCDSLSEKIVLKKLTDSDRKYLIGLGLIKEREVIKDYNALYVALRMKADQINSLTKKYLSASKVLKNKGIEPLKDDKLIQDAKALYEELKLWLEFTKTSEPKYAFKSPKDLKTDELGFVPKLQLAAKVAKKEFSPSVAKRQKQQSSGEQQNLYDLIDNLENENE